MVSDKDKLKGIIELDSRPTVCHMCGKILVQTYVEKTDIDRMTELYVICGDCIKTFPMTLRVRLTGR